VMRLAYSDDPVAAVETERTKNAVAERKAEQPRKTLALMSANQTLALTSAPSNSLKRPWLS
jgi:hypothetical protein